MYQLYFFKIPLCVCSISPGNKKVIWWFKITKQVFGHNIIIKNTNNYTRMYLRLFDKVMTLTDVDVNCLLNVKRWHNTVRRSFWSYISIFLSRLLTKSYNFLSVGVSPSSLTLSLKHLAPLACPFCIGYTFGIGISLFST